MLPAPAEACTAFSVSTPHGPLLAKGFDWVTGEGWIVANERGRTRSLLFPGAAPNDDGSWTSRFASLSLTTIGPGFPVSGMNEEGLAIEALVDLHAAPVATAEPGRLTGLELIQYALDRFASVEEFADFAAGERVTQLAVALHFFACDRSGACAVVEPGRDGTRVTRGLQVKALANNPYRTDLETMRPNALTRWLGWGGPVPGSSGARFRTVARAIGSLPPKTAEEGLALLEKVVMRGRTQWQIVWDLKGRTVLLRQREAGFGTIGLKLDDLEKACAGAPRALSIGRTAHASFAPWSEQDSGLAERAVLLQVGRAGPQASRLAAAVAAATRVPGCVQP
jgi:choloylglycine hydrolase